MNPHDMLDYTLGLLEDPRRGQVERAVAADPALADRLGRLRANLDLLLDDGDDPRPPSGLAGRTIVLVESRRQRRSIHDYAPVRSPFRWSDFAVAAGIFLVGLITLLPAMKRSQSSAHLAGCTENLRQIGLGLMRYANTHNMFPVVPPNSELPYPGVMASALAEGGFLDSMTTWDCPGDGPNSDLPPRPPGVAELQGMVMRGPESTPCLVNNDYASHIGYFDPQGWKPVSMNLASQVPMFADHPPHRDNGFAEDGNSPNHAGRGQNVLFGDMHVGFNRTRQLGPDRDIYRNRLGHTAPGLGRDDFVLGAGHVQVLGRP